MYKKEAVKDELSLSEEDRNQLFDLINEDKK
jgi:hypothetical protein